MCHSDDVSKMSLDREVDVVANWDFLSKHREEKTKREEAEHTKVAIDHRRRRAHWRKKHTAKRESIPNRQEFRDVWTTLKICEARDADEEGETDGALCGLSAPCVRKSAFRCLSSIEPSATTLSCVCAHELGRLMRRAENVFIFAKRSTIKNASSNHYQINFYVAHSTALFL